MRSRFWLHSACPVSQAISGCAGDFPVRLAASSEQNLCGRPRFVSGTGSLQCSHRFTKASIAQPPCCCSAIARGVHLGGALPIGWENLRNTLMQHDRLFSSVGRKVLSHQCHGCGTLTPPVLVRIQVPQPPDDPEPTNGRFIQNVQSTQYRRPEVASHAVVALPTKARSFSAKNCPVGSPYRMECRTRFALRKASLSRQACQVSRQSLTFQNWQPDGDIGSVPARVFQLLLNSCVNPKRPVP